MPNITVSRLAVKISYACDVCQQDKLRPMCSRRTYIREEAYAGNNNGADMVPAEWCSVYLRESKTSTLIGILDVNEFVVEVGVR
jgi:hypothetical protein